MGLDLTIGIVEYPQMNRWLLYNRIMFDRMSFDCIKVLNTHPLPIDKLVDWYTDEGIKRIRTNAYGEELTVINPIEFWRINTDKMSKWNQLLIAFLRQLDIETLIVLYWH